MAKRNLNLRAKAFGFETVIAKVTIEKLAEEISADAETTDLVCPKCNQKPSYKGGYECSCGAKYGHWMALKRVLKGTFTAIVKQKLGTDKETFADLYRMEMAKFAQFVDAVRVEHGISVKDEASAKNLYKLLVATKKLNIAILAFWNDTYEQRIALLTTSVSGTILLREIIPRNLAVIRDVLRVDATKITETDVKEAEAFLGQIPEASETMMDITDYRTQLLVPEKVEAIKEATQVQELEAILAKAK